MAHAGGGVKLLMFHDSPDFGGHERMLLALLPAVLDDPRLSALAMTVPSANARLRAGLETLGVRTIDWPFEKRRAEPYLRGLRLRYRAAVRALIAAERPDTVLLVQGRIENTAVPMMAVPRGPRLVSYVPMAHLLAEMGRGAIGDRVRRALYARPDAFVVPSEAVAAQVRSAGGSAPVAVAHNVVDPPLRTERDAARAALGLPSAGRIALSMGRLDVAQKGLDVLLAAIARGGRGLAGWTVLFVGDGPGRPEIEAAGGVVRLVPWTDRPDLYLSAADALLLPSRWEGVPLVMLEAMAYGLPILASGIDVFELYLPRANRVDFAAVDLGPALEAITAPVAAAAFAAHSAAKLAPLTLESARRTFVDTLAGGRA